MKTIQVLSGVMAFLLMASAAGADTVTLRNGTIIEGTIVVKNNRYLAITTPQSNGAENYYLAEDIAKVNDRQFRHFRLPKSKLLTQKIQPEKGKKYPLVTITLKDGREFSGELVKRNTQYFRIIPAGKDNYQEFLVSDIASLR